MRMDHTAVLPNSTFAAVPTGGAEFVRPSGVDLPSLAESVRSVEERIARQSAEYESLNRAYERARDVEAASVARANALAVDLAAARAALESEHGRSREMDRLLNDRSSLVETARSRVEEALRESERAQVESRTLRDSLAARDGTIAQVLHSLGERDAQLAALQLEHSKMVPVLEATSKSSSQLESDLNECSCARRPIPAPQNCGPPGSRWPRSPCSSSAAQRNCMPREPSWGPPQRRRALISNCCGLANGAMASIRTCSASSMRRSARPMRGTARSNPNAIACERRSAHWSPSWPLKEPRSTSFRPRRRRMRRRSRSRPMT